jgi:ABC-2 type transport system ATP-binding protein
MIEVSTPAQLGGRATSLATISWRDGAEVKTAQSAEPTQFVQKLAAQFGGEVPELSVKRASLEDIYLQMIGDTHA